MSTRSPKGKTRQTMVENTRIKTYFCTSCSLGNLCLCGFYLQAEATINIVTCDQIKMRLCNSIVHYEPHKNKYCHLMITTHPTDLDGALTTNGLWLSALGGMKSLTSKEILLSLFTKPVKGAAVWKTWSTSHIQTPNKLPAWFLNQVWVECLKHTHVISELTKAMKGAAV